MYYTQTMARLMKTMLVNVKEVNSLQDQNSTNLCKIVLHATT